MNIVHTKEFLLVNIPRITPQLLNYPIAQAYGRRSKVTAAPENSQPPRNSGG